MKQFGRITWAVLLLIVSLSLAVGQVPLFEENFSFTAVDLIGQNGWSLNGSATTVRLTVSPSSGLSYIGYAGSDIGNSLALQAATGDKAQSRTWPAVSSGSIYAAMMINVSAATTGDYFFTYFDNGTFRARLYVKNDGSGIQFGLSKGTGNTVYTSSTPYSLKSTHLVVVKYTFVGVKAADDSISLFINPPIGTAEPKATIPSFVDSSQSDLAQIGRIVLRQNSSAGPALLIDGFRIATSWPIAVAGTPSSSSDVITSGNETPNIPYASFQTDSIKTTVDAVRVWSFTVRDGGTTTDSDVKPTVLASVSIDQGTATTMTDWSSVIRRAALFVDSVKVADASSITSSQIVFSGLSGSAVTVADGEVRRFDLYVSFQSRVIDNKQFHFQIQPATISGPAGSGSYSRFSSFPSQSSASANDANRIEVTATLLGFMLQPTDVGLAIPVNPAVSVEARDVLGSRDADFSGRIEVTASGASLKNSPVAVQAAEGIAVFTDLTFTTGGTGVLLKAQTAGGQWETVSTSFNVVSGPFISVSALTPFGNQVVNTISASKLYTVSGTGLTGTITITPPAGFEISLKSDSGYIRNPATVVLAVSGAAIQPTPIFVRFAPQVDGGLISASIVHTSTTSLVKQLSVSGNALSIEPDRQSVVTVVAVTKNSIGFSFTGGSGNHRLVVARALNSVSYSPTDGETISGTVSNDFATASDQGSGNKIIYDGNGTSVTVTGLSTAVTYYFALYEYNVGTGTSRNYRTALPGTASQTTGSRYETEVFSTYQLQSDILYGQSKKADGSLQNLLLDLYLPTGDSERNRPLVVFIHGGGFKSNDKVGSYSTLVCGGLARRGYVVTSINYRLTPTITTDKEHFEAMIRALQDAKAAIRFFRKNATLYGIDSTQIFATGSSAGSITALHLAYLDEQEVPVGIDLAGLGGLEGSSGNPGYSSRIQGVINCWGAIGDTSWMKRGDVPVYSVHGLNDQTVYFDQIPSDGPFLYGSKHIYERAKNLGLITGLRTFFNTGHTLDDNKTKQDSAYRDFGAWLYSLLKTGTPTRIDESVETVPSSIILHQNYPNPFNPSTTILYELPYAEQADLVVFDVLGRKLATLATGIQRGGLNAVVFHASSFPSGLYILQLKTSTMTFSKKMVLMR